MSKENAEDSDVDSGHNSIDRYSLATETQLSSAGRGGVPKLSDIQTDTGKHTTNIWIDETINPANNSNNCVVYVGDSVIYHDPIKPTDEQNCSLKEEEEEEVEGVSVFMTDARKKSVLIPVDRWTTDTATVKEVPLESQMNAGNTSPEVIYATVNKTKSSPHGVVDKTKAFEDGQMNQVGDYADVIDGQNTDDIGDANDIYSEVYQGQSRKAGKNVYAYVEGRVMVISDEGDYASVKSLTDSDSSKNTQGTFVGEPVEITGNAIQSSQSEDASVKRNQYAVQYIGSLPVAEEDLSPQRCTIAVSRGIDHVSHSRDCQDGRSIVEWPKNSRMFLETCESKRVLTLRSSDSVAVLDEHFLSSIRFWAVGKDANSKHFAYVIRNASKKHVCRVFLCDVAAKHIASTIRNICHRLAIEAKRKSVDSMLLDSATETMKHRTTAKSDPAGVIFMKSTAVSECHYIGVIKVNKRPGKDLVNSATENVFKKIAKEQWARVDLLLSPTSITIQEFSNFKGKSTILSKQSIIYMGSSTKNKKLSAVFTQKDDMGTFAHIFHCEPGAEDFIKQMQAACEISQTDKNGKSANQPTFQQKSLKGLLFGKSKGKKQGNEIDSQ